MNESSSKMQFGTRTLFVLIALSSVLTLAVCFVRGKPRPKMPPHTLFVSSGPIGSVEVYTEINAELFRNKPHWNLTNRNPPLSQHKAEQAALQYVNKLVDEERIPPGAFVTFSGWEIYDSDNYFWIVRFKYQEWPKPKPTFAIVVLMDGSVVDPLIFDVETEEQNETSEQLGD